MKADIFTTAQSGKEQSEVFFTSAGNDVEKGLINLFPHLKYQSVEGFGGAITDAAGYVYSLMNEEQKRVVISAYFGPDDLRYRLVRVHMDSCDFSCEMYEAMSDETDVSLESFSFERTQKYIIPMLEDACRAAADELELMLTPWSPPAFMKTNGTRKYGGKLKPEYREMWAEYVCRYIEEFQKRGYKVSRISVQNEPKAVQTWDSCVFTAKEEQEFLRDFLVPAMKRHSLDDIEVFIWDHNKERAFERAAAEVDETTQGLISGVACHWYSGDHFEQLDMIHESFPDLKIILSESCIERSLLGGEAQVDNAIRLAHELIGDLNHGMCAFYDWNILLDEEGGPNHVGNFCDAPFLFHREHHQLLSTLYKDFYWHFSHFIQPGARRIGLSRYTDVIDAAGFENPDGTIVVIALNRTEDTMPAIFRMEDQEAETKIPGKALCTMVVGR